MKKVGFLLLVVLTVAQTLTYFDVADTLIWQSEEKAWNLTGEEENTVEEETSDDHLLVKGLILDSTIGFEITHSTFDFESDRWRNGEVIAPPPRKKRAA